MIKLLSKCQTADHSDSEAILTLLKYDRTELFVPSFANVEFRVFPGVWLKRV
jgi:hypothetical protein